MIMEKASQVKIVSVDLFRTLIDLEQTPKIIWEIFLRENFPDEMARKYWQRADEILWRRWDEAGTEDGPFKSIRTILEDTVNELFGEINLGYDPKLSANALIGDHSLQNVFDDAKQFLEEAGQKYPICLSTDCDTEMLENIDQLYSFDSIFVSEELKNYKLNPRFFSHVIKHYNVAPNIILHIGDSKSDIITPKQIGIQTCWLNRCDLKWNHPVKPDFEVKSLLEILDILD
jgi:HAD superfamily hydrolase (TIGR01549 family)